MLLDHFPGTPRKEQKRILEEIEKEFNKGTKYIIIEAPTGVGKSHIAATIARASSHCDKSLHDLELTPFKLKTLPNDALGKFGGHILTTTKQLQDQYDVLFSDSAVIKGKNNYTCPKFANKTPLFAKCAFDRGLVHECYQKGTCPYLIAFRNAILNNFSVLSYSLFLTLPANARRKEVLICDEASEIEDSLVESFTVNIKYSELKKYDVSFTKLLREDRSIGFLWLNELLESLRIAMPSKSELSRKNVSKKLLTKAFAIKGMGEQIKRVLKFWNDAEFIIELNKDGINISPLKVNRISRLVFSGVDRVIFMSATIINHVKFAETLGLSKNEYRIIKAKSTFDPTKSPIYIGCAAHDMTYKNIDNSLNGIYEDIIGISEEHKNENGVIHTHSGKITKYLKVKLNGDKRYIIRDGKIKNEDILYEHFNRADPTVLISPSLAFGTSLDNEHGRFQIVTKLPYLPLQTKRIKILAKRDFEWYSMKMWTALIQMCGRCTRSKDDYSVTYILDKSIVKALNRNMRKLPEWFIDRIK